MAIYINGDPLDLRTLRNDDGKFIALDSTDEIKKLFCDAWKELDYRFWSKNIPVEFRTPSIMSGGGPGNRGYSYPRSLNYKTKKRGTVNIAWADERVSEDGKLVYKPVSRLIGVNEKTLLLDQDDVEEALFMWLFNPMVVRKDNPSGMTFLVDREEDARVYAEKETKSAVIAYWLYREESPLYENDKAIGTLCLAYGISPENKTITYQKQLLSNAVKNAEAHKDPEFGFNGFNSICEKLRDGQDTKDVDTLALIQRCTNAHIIEYDKDKLVWVLLDEQSRPVKTICKVPPQQVSSSRLVLKRHLMASADDFSTLVSAAGGDPRPAKSDKIALSIGLPDELTEDWIENTMPWPDKKKVYTFIKGDGTHATKETVVPTLIEYFITQKKTIQWELKK